MKVRRLAASVGAAFVIGAACFAQADKPVHPAAPAFQPEQKKDQPTKPKIYDENADAKKQIADAVAKAKKNNRRVLVQWGGDWCIWCIKLHQLFDSDKAIKEKLRNEYDVVYIHIGRDGKNIPIAEEMGANLRSFPYLTILDSAGKAVVHQETGELEDPDKEKMRHDPKKVLEFLTKHQAAKLEAQKILDEGIATAQKSGRNVFLHFGAPWCVYCHKLEAWMARPEIEPVLGKQFVDVKIDIDRTIGGKEVLAKFNTGGDGGIPWFVFLDSSGKPIVDSNGPKGNVGFPVSPEEIAYFGEMLKKGAPKLDEADAKKMLGTLGEKK